MTEENKITLLNCVITLSEFCNGHTCPYCPLSNEFDTCDLYEIESVNIADLKRRIENYKGE